MNVCMDLQSAIEQTAGVGRYTRELYKALASMASLDLRGCYFDFRGKADPGDLPPARLRAIRKIPGRAAQFLWKTLGVPPYDAFAGPADVYHFPNFVLPPLRHGRAVVTIHDVGFLRYPEFAESRNLRHLRRWLPRTVGRADAIVAVSEFSRHEIAELLRVPPERIHVTYPGIDPRFVPSSPDSVAILRRRLQLPRPYLLMLGTLEPRKNHLLAIDLFERWTDFDGQLVFAGRKGWKCEPILRRMQASARSADIRLLDYVDEKVLPDLYSGAEILLFPSHYEGFGFPPLEAMACGTPVLCARRASMPEVLGEAAVYCDSLDADEWKAATARLHADAALRRDLAARGQRHAAQYRWKRTARQTLDVYAALSP